MGERRKRPVMWRPTRPGAYLAAALLLFVYTGRVPAG